MYIYKYSVDADYHHVLGAYFKCFSSYISRCGCKRSGRVDIELQRLQGVININ